jgi:hypothetical protein
MAEANCRCDKHDKPGRTVNGTIEIWGCPDPSCIIVANGPGLCATHNLQLEYRGTRQIAICVCEDCLREAR